MPNTVQDFLAAATAKAAADLIAALDLIPAEKRASQPTGNSRSALDQVAECALLNGASAEAIAGRSAPSGDFMASYWGLKDALVQNEEETRALLRKNTDLLIEALRATEDADLDTEIAMPWKPMTLREVCSYPFWNLTYHQGQVYYISTLV